MTAEARPRPTPARGAPPPGLAARRRRPRLSALLGVSLAPVTRLTMVSAPPGYGKSVAVAGWIADGTIPAAWATLDAAAADPARLARAVLAALADARPAAATLAQAIAPGAVPDPGALADLIVDAVATDERDLVMVLDDCHFADGREAATLLDRLVERLPPFCHLVLVGREDPGVRLGRLRAHGALVEVRAGDLRFTDDEARTFLGDAGLDPGAASVEGLIGRTEGWAAALQLASIALASAVGPAIGAEALSGTHRTWPAFNTMAAVIVNVGVLVAIAR